MTYSEWRVMTQCGTKIAWATKREAKKAATDSARHYEEDRANWRAYKCPHCCLWHCGHVNHQLERLKEQAA